MKIDTGRKLAGLIGRGERGRWLVVLLLGALVSGIEALSTLMVFALLGVLVGGANDLSLPLIGNLMAHLQQPGTNPLAVLGFATAAIFLLRSGLVLAQAYVETRVAENAGARLSVRLLAGYLSMPYVLHLQRNSSEMVRNAFDSVQRAVREGLLPGIQLVGRLATVAGIFGVLVVADAVSTAFAVLALGPLTWLILRLLHPLVKRLGRISQAMTKQNLQMLQQCLHGVREITVLGRERNFLRAYECDRRELARTRYLRQTAANVPRVGIETGVILFILVFIWVATVSEDGVQQALPMLGLFGYAAIRIMPELNYIAKTLNSLRFVGPAIDDIHRDLRVFRTVPPKRARAAARLPFEQSLVARGVWFRYPGSDRDALRDVDVEIRACESVGIVGPSGGGKSTLVDVLVGLLPPTQGEVRVDGVNILDHVRAWQANIGIVPQMVFLLDDTLRRNIALGVPDNEVHELALWDAIRIAQLQELVETLPQHLDTIVGERGVRLSGGQRQRLAIARALYRRPRVLLFDEGTSALDNATEAAFLDGLAQLRGQHTLIMVAHRLTTVEDCDRILLVRDGRIVDQGPFVELASRHPDLQQGGDALAGTPATRPASA